MVYTPLQLIRQYLFTELVLTDRLLCMAKSRVYSFRISEELGQMFDQLKASQAHPRVPTAELLVEAFRLYVELGKRYGLDNAVKVKLPKSLQQLRRMIWR